MNGSILSGEKNPFGFGQGEIGEMGTMEEQKRTMEEQKQGTVKWFNDEKGYGFLVYENKDIFVHQSDINMSGHRTLKEGQNVTFSIEQGDKGPKAKEVTIQ